MTTRTLKKIWLTTVSRAALRFSLAVERDALTSETQLALGLVARIRLWFQMLWGSVQRTETLSPVLTDIPPNRYYKRRRNSRPSKQSRVNPLTLLMLRHRGLIACQQWLYHYSVAGRIWWCFHHLNPIFANRRTVTFCESGFAIAAICNAPLSPD